MKCVLKKEDHILDIEFEGLYEDIFDVGIDGQIMKEYIKEIYNILAEFSIKNGEDYFDKEPEELAIIYENMKVVQEEHDLSDEDMEEVIESVLEELEE